LVTAVEAFEVLKLGLGTDFQLLSVHSDATRIGLNYKKPIPPEVLEWRRSAPVENTILNTVEQ
jgi:hypothetical protein